VLQDAPEYDPEDNLEFGVEYAAGQTPLYEEIGLCSVFTAFDIFSDEISCRWIRQSGALL
jgi:hypothetical protein